MRTPHQHQQSLRRQISTLPRKIATEAHAFFDDNFRKQGFHDEVLHRWAPRQPIKGRRRRGNERRGILILTGALRRSLHAQVKGKTIIIQSIMPYARFHNEGLPMRNGKRITRRQFVGNSRTLNARITQLINKTLQQS